MSLESTLRPTAGPLNGLFDIVIRLVELRALVKGHHDVTAQIVLDRDGLFR